MKHISRLSRTALIGSLWLITLLAVILLSDIPHAQAKVSKEVALTKMHALSIQDHNPVSVTQVLLSMVLSGPLPDIPADYMIVEGDIQIPKSAFASRYSMKKTGQMPADGIASPEGTFETNSWTNGIVPYEFDANVTAANQATAQQAMSDWEAIANVQFTQCANNTCSGDYIHIQASPTSNNSAIGRQGGRQIINITSWNWRYIIAHELGHALGFEHEQSRSDRNSYIQINYNNVCKATDTSCNGCFDGNGNRIDCDFNFNIAASALAYGTYDFDSVMHYSRAAFSRNGNDTITVLPPNDTQWQNTIGQRMHLSTMDQLTMSFLYPQFNWRFVDNTYTGSGESGTFLKPYKTFAVGVNATPSNGTLWVLEQGEYPAAGTYDKAMTIRAALGAVVLR